MTGSYKQMSCLLLYLEWLIFTFPWGGYGREADACGSTVLIQHHSPLLVQTVTCYSKPCATGFIAGAEFPETGNNNAQLLKIDQRRAETPPWLSAQIAFNPGD